MSERPTEGHRPLVIAGTGLFAEVAKAYFEEFTQYRVVAFTCHARFKEADAIYGAPLYEFENIATTCPPDSHEMFVAIGYGKMNRHRQLVYGEARGLGYRLASFVHPNVKIWSSTTLGDNVFIFEDNTVQPFTSIGADTVLWSGNHVGHHTRIGSHSFISSHVVISGSCNVGDNVFIGVNATLRDGIKIGDGTLIGAGAVIMKDTQPKEAYVPARTMPIDRNTDQLRF